jgi:ADP-heptose:LPS heptosyltransferase
MRILVLQLKRIGDAILTAPALRALKMIAPDARVTVMLHGPSGGLAGLLPGADEVLIWKPGGMNLGILRAIAGGPWDTVLDFTGTDRSFFLAALTRADQRFAYAKAAGSSWWKSRVTNFPVEASVTDLSTVDLHLAMVRAWAEQNALPAPIESEPPHLKLPETKPGEISPTGRYAVLHPGTARDEKYWPAERWVAVARYLQATHGLDLVLTGSKDEREMIHLAPIRAAGLAIRDEAGKQDLAGSARIIAGATLVLTVDSAAMHLAGQFGRPQIALFGPTNPFHWAPRHAHAVVLGPGGRHLRTEALSPRGYEEGPMESIPAERVMAAIDGLLGAGNGGEENR